MGRCPETWICLVVRGPFGSYNVSQMLRELRLPEMNSKFAVSVLAGVALLAALTPLVSAHHGGGVEWQRQVEGPITGVATEFAFRFPHVVIYIDVTDGNGDAQKWALNTRWTPTILRQHGWTRNSIKPGDTVAVTYRPHVTEPTVANMVTIEVNGKDLPLQF